jgi:hypothetical protein
MKIKQYLRRSILKRYLPYPYRVYNDATRSTFIYIPKTAGSSLLQAIGAPERGRLHIDYTHFMRSDPVRYDSYFKFAVVRDPVGRAYSCYRYLISGGNQSEEDAKLRDMITRTCSSFDGFVQDFLTPSILASWDLLRPQVSFVCSRSGELMVDFILKYESLDNDYKRLCEYLPMVALELPHINISNRSQVVPTSPETVDKLKEYYHLDFEHFYA